MVSKHLVFSTILNYLDVLAIFSADIMDGEGSDLACFQLPNNLTPQQNPIARFEQEQSLRFIPPGLGLCGIKLSVRLCDLGNRFHTF